MAEPYNMPNAGSPLVDDKGVSMMTWVKFFRDLLIGLKAEKAPRRVSLFNISVADLADAAKFLQAGANLGLGVQDYLGWAKANGNNSTLVQSAVAAVFSRQTLTAGVLYTTPANCIAIMVTCQGAGGGGGGANTVAGGAAVGSGGMAGSWAQSFIVSPLASYACAIGALGAGGAAGLNGSTGGDTTFGGGLLVAKGGLGGAGMTPAAATPLIAETGISGYTTSVGDIKKTGVTGMRAIRISGTIAASGAGGDSDYGRAGVSAISAAIGSAAAGYGGGGGGGCVINGSAAVAGGNGAPGIIIVDEICAANAGVFLERV